jgi:flavin reductase (DIM6/NTAB) family NADH-FMN oxidoreductase RutF
VEVQPYPRANPNCHLVFAEVLLAHIDDEVLTEAGRVDPQRLDLVGRLGGSAYARTRETFNMQRPS